MEEGNVSYPDTGTPQGGVISPFLATIYLHYVLDEWYEKTVRPLMNGKSCLIRFADDFVIIFAMKYDAQRVMDVIPKRFAKYGLMVHPDKTKLIDFRSPEHNDRRFGRNFGKAGTGSGAPGTFDLLGFTHYWGKTKNGNWVVQRKTMRARLTRGIRSIDQWCRNHRHCPMKEQWKKLCEKVRGHYGYYGITGNGRSLGQFIMSVERSWKRWLSRRNRKRRYSWEKFLVMLKRYPLPIPKIVHTVMTRSKDCRDGETI